MKSPNSNTLAAVAAGAVLVLLLTAGKPAPWTDHPGLDIDAEPTFTKQQARAVADGVYQALYGDGGCWSGDIDEDEGLAVRLLSTCQNDADVALVATAYGVRSGCWLWAGQGLNLFQALGRYLSASDLDELNSTWRARGITFAL